MMISKRGPKIASTKLHCFNNSRRWLNSPWLLILCRELSIYFRSNSMTPHQQTGRPLANFSPSVISPDSPIRLSGWFTDVFIEKKTFQILMLAHCMLERNAADWIMLSWQMTDYCHAPSITGTSCTYEHIYEGIHKGIHTTNECVAAFILLALGRRHHLARLAPALLRNIVQRGELP